MEWFVPTPDRRTLAVEDSHIPAVETWFFEDEGHALRESHIEEIHAWLVAHSF